MSGLIAKSPLITIILLGLSGVISLLTRNFVTGGTILLIDLIFFLACFKKIPAAPPHVGQVIFWGRRIPGAYKKEGYCLLAPFFPFFLNVILVNVEKKNKDFHPKNVRSKEKAQLATEVSVTYTPDPDNLIQYINSGGKAGVDNILDDIIEEGAREYAVNLGWEELLAAQANFYTELIKDITGIDDPAELIRINKEIRRGNGLMKLPGLGIILNRFNMGTIEVKGKLAEDADKVAVENRQREAEKVEIEHVGERAKDLKDKLGISSEDAIEVVQTERGKVTKKINEIKGLDKFGEGIGKILSK